MSPRSSAKLAFASALILLFLSGVAVLLVISRFSENSDWVVKTYELQVATSEVETSLSDAARARINYISSGDASYILQYDEIKTRTYSALDHVRVLAKESIPQQAQVNQLEELANQKFALMKTSFDLRASGRPDTDRQSAITLQNTKMATDVAAVVDQMHHQEEMFLDSRKNESAKLFSLVLWILGVLLAGALVLFWTHYHLLNQELGKRELAEGGARRLSAHVLQLQDEERRKFSRELHDGLGQNLAAAKMIASSLSEKYPTDGIVVQLLRVVDQTIVETRTISHLLHPILLDELGLASAISWYVEGFSERSGLQISTHIADSVGRLSRPLELVLFRVLQESLTNVHRHSKSAGAEVSLSASDGHAILFIRDYGIGIPAEKLKHFRSDGTHVGVGLTGMRERVREQGGKFEIQSNQSGTEVQVSVPMHTSPLVQDKTTIGSGAI